MPKRPVGQRREGTGAGATGTGGILPGRQNASIATEPPATVEWLDPRHAGARAVGPAERGRERPLRPNSRAERDSSVVIGRARRQLDARPALPSKSGRPDTRVDETNDTRW